MAQVIIIRGDEVFVLPNIQQHEAEALKKNRVYNRHAGNSRFSKDLRRMLLGLEIEKLKKELYLVDEG